MKPSTNPMTPEERKQAMLLTLFSAFNYAAEACVDELKTFTKGGLIRQQVKMILNQMDNLNKRLVSEMLKKFSKKDGETIDSLTNDLIDISILFATMSKEERRAIIDEVTERKHANAQTAA